MTRLPASLSPTMLRGIVAAVLGVALSTTVTVTFAHRITARTTARLNSAATQLDSITEGSADDPRRAAIAWGYVERLRLGLESPFRLVDAASRDQRLSADQRRTVASALLAHIMRGETSQPDASALDGIGPVVNGAAVTGEQHRRLIRAAVATARDPRVAELAVRTAYELAVSERIVDPSASILAAE